ncbi:MAG: lyase family protein [Pseudomonadota bacterium]
MINLADHPWMSGVFGDPDIAALFSPDAELKRFLKVEAAWARALGEVEAHPATQGIADAILGSQITASDLAQGYARDGVPIPALVTSVKAELGEDASRLLHRSLTSQDVMDTSLCLALREAVSVLVQRLETLNMSLAGLHDRMGAAKIVAITRMQPALPTDVGHVIGLWRQPIAGLLGSSAEIVGNVSVIQWGGPIGRRDHPRADALGQAFAQHLDLEDPGYAWHTDRSRVLEFGVLLARICNATGKIGEDVALLAALGADYVVFDGGGSSAMPHKNNPVTAEALVALSDYAATLSGSLVRAGRHEGARSGRAWTLEGMVLPQLTQVTGASLLNAVKVVESITRLGADDPR